MNRRSFFKRFGLTACAVMVGVNVVQISPIPKRKLKAAWSYELAQDIRYLHGIDVDMELARIISTQVQQDIDNEILNMIYKRTTV